MITHNSAALVVGSFFGDRGRRRPLERCRPAQLVTGDEGRDGRIEIARLDQVREHVVADRLQVDLDGHAIRHHRQHPALRVLLARVDRLNDIGSLTFCMTEPGTALPLVVVACQNIFISCARAVEEAVAHQPQIGIARALERSPRRGRRSSR